MSFDLAAAKSEIWAGSSAKIANPAKQAPNVSNFSNFSRCHQPNSVILEGRRRLQVLSEKWNHSLADLLHWYKDDLKALGEMSREAAYKTVRQYMEEYRD